MNETYSSTPPATAPSSPSKLSALCSDSDSPLCEYEGVVLPRILLDVLSEALESPTGGEILVERGDARATIYVHQGKLAWTSCSTVPENLGQSLERDTGLGRAELRQVFLRCVETGSSLAESLLSTGKLEHEPLHHALLSHNARHFHAVLSLGTNISVHFTPQGRRYSALFLYSFKELVHACLELPDGDIARARRAVALEQSLSRASIELGGAETLMYVDMKSGRTLARWPFSHVDDDVRSELAEHCLRALDVANMAEELVFPDEDGQLVGRRCSFFSEQGFIFAEVLTPSIMGIIVCCQTHRFGTLLARAGSLLKKGLEE